MKQTYIYPTESCVISFQLTKLVGQLNGSYHNCSHPNFLTAVPTPALPKSKGSFVVYKTVFPPFRLHSSSSSTATITMSLNCLSCGVYDEPVPPRRNAEPEQGNHCVAYRMALCCGVDRSWSGNLTPTPCAQLRIMSISESRGERSKAHRKRVSDVNALPDGTGAGEEVAEPRLVRSRGMRRDWCFEDVNSLGVH